MYENFKQVFLYAHTQQNSQCNKNIADIDNKPPRKEIAFKKIPVLEPSYCKR